MNSKVYKHNLYLLFFINPLNVVLKLVIKSKILEEEVQRLQLNRWLKDVLTEVSKRVKLVQVSSLLPNDRNYKQNLLQLDDRFERCEREFDGYVRFLTESALMYSSRDVSFICQWVTASLPPFSTGTTAIFLRSLG